MLATRVCRLSHFSHNQPFAAPWSVPSRLLCPWDSPGKDTEVCSHASSRGPSQPRDQPLSLMSPELAGRFFPTSSTWEAPQGAHIKPNRPKALTHQRASRGTRQALAQIFSKGAGPFNYRALFFSWLYSHKILFSALVRLSSEPGFGLSFTHSGRLLGMGVEKRKSRSCRKISFVFWKPGFLEKMMLCILKGRGRRFLWQQTSLGADYQKAVRARGSDFLWGRLLWSSSDPGPWGREPPPNE